MTSFGRGRGTRGRRKGFGDNGFAEWGGYMAAKKAKLEDQFSIDAAKESGSLNEIFKNVAVFVDGYTDPSADEIKRIMMVHGGTFHTYLSHKTTHIIAKNLPDTKVKCLKGNEPICRPNWIVDSLKEGKLLDYRNYLLYSSQSSTQPKLHFESLLPNPVKENTAQKVSGSDNKTNRTTIDAKDDKFLSEFYNNSRLHHISSMGASFKKYVSDLRSIEDNFLFPERNKLKDLTKQAPFFKETNQKTYMHIDMDCFFVSVGLRNKPEYRGLPVVVTHSKGKSSTISSNAEIVRKEAEMYEARQFRGAIKCDPKTSTLVGAASVTKDDTFTSMAEIASCSYEARNFGIKNGMFMGTALQLCPGLKTITYDFEGYQKVAKVLYDTVSKYTLEIQAVSCDEMLVDLTDLIEDCKICPNKFSQILRREIFDATGCTASVGLGPSLLLARLATRKAKPDGIFHLKSEDAQEFMRSVSVQDLPGVGRKMSKKFQSLEISTCSELQRLSLDRLLREFGPKSGQSLYEFSRGIDHRQLNVEQDRKSVSAEVNYGIRFEREEDAQKFLAQMSEEVHQRMVKLGNVRGRTIQLKVMVRAKEASKETAKFMGHGICDSYSRTVNLHVATNDPVIIQREAWHLLKQLNANPEDLRGIGIQVSKLENFCETGFKARNPTSILNFLRKPEKDEAPVYAINPGINEEDPKKTTAPEFVKNLPRFSSIDHNVLNELPEDLRRELLEFYNIKTDQKPEEINKPPSPVPSTSRGLPPSITSYDDLSFSQLDQGVIAELPPEIVEEVMEQMSRRPIKNVPTSAFDQLKRVPAASPVSVSNKRGRPPKGSQTKNNTSSEESNTPTKEKAKRVLFSERSRPPIEDPEQIVQRKVSRATKICFATKQPATLEGRRSIEDIRTLFRAWIQSTNEPTSDDAETVEKFLKELVDENNLDLVFQTLKSLHRQSYSILGKRSHASWTQCYENIKLEVNLYVQRNCGRLLFTDFKL